MGRYAIAKEDEYTLIFFYRNINGFIAMTRIVPTTFPNKKKAKRVMKRLNKYHGGGYFLFDYQEALKGR
jgi:hypothetical protein